jgi:hypothetical protein
MRRQLQQGSDGGAGKGRRGKDRVLSRSDGRGPCGLGDQSQSRRRRGLLGRYGKERWRGECVRLCTLRFSARRA